MPEPNQSFTPHEALELHELLSLEVMEMKKLNSTRAMLQDSELLDFIDDVSKAKEQNIGELKEFISSSMLH